MAVTERSLRFAVRIIARHGDTDVFPFPLENHWFHDDEDGVVALLGSMDRDFDSWLRDYPVVFVKLLAGVGYAGFRAATQIDPLWNAYLLSLVIEIAPDIEDARVPPDRNVVFSYRYNPSEEKSTLFDPDLGWRQFHTSAIAVAESADVVVSTDISDFYPRVYHHRLENALRQATTNTEVVRRIMEILERLSSGTSYGLPVGGHAARILADLLLNRVDRLLLAQQIRFCRFVDDYCLFAMSREKAQAHLVFLSESLLANEGLTLSRSKTRFMTRAEFLRSSPFAEPAAADSEEESEARGFLRLRLRFDPYSPTAEEDYGRLAADIEKFDVTRMLARELRKSRIDEVLVRQLVKSLRFMGRDVRDGAVVSLLRNFEILYPVFPTVAILLKGVLADLSDGARRELFDALRSLVRRDSHITLVPTNLAYAVRLMAHDRSEETDAIFVDLHGRTRTDMMVKRDIVLAMTARRADYWLSDLIKRFSVLIPWERRALLPASYVLGDEGRHWRERVRDELSQVDRGFMQWVGTKNSGKSWDVPL
ncbi:MAG: RNA-directed DNA polymerase [Pseudomonadota bacterium]|nr:RNA-directed DNA polymerase [Pseudomonadota bacterium]